VPNGMPGVKRFGAGDRLYVQAQQIWLILAAHIMHSRERRNRDGIATIYYGDVAEAMGRPDRRAGHTLGRQLGIIARYCVANDIAPLNAIVVTQGSGTPGVEVILREGRSLAREQRAVMHEDWFSIRVPTTGMFKRVWMHED